MAHLRSPHGPDIEAASRFLLGLPVSESMRTALVYQLPVREVLQNELLHTYYVKEQVGPLRAAPVTTSTDAVAYRWPGGRYQANSRPSWSFKKVPTAEVLLSDPSEETMRQCFHFFDSSGTGVLLSQDFLRKLWASLAGDTVDGRTCDQQVLELRELISCAEHPTGSGEISIQGFLARY